MTVPKEERRDPVKMYNLMKVSDLQVNFTGVTHAACSVYLYDYGLKHHTYV